MIDLHILMMEALGRAIAKRDSDTGTHNYRVAWISVCIAEHMNLPEPDIQALIAGSFLHDIGKVGIPDSVLLKPGKLTDAEFEVMCTHVTHGEEIVTGMNWLDGVNDIVAAHHEKWDGSGYPRKLAGENIPRNARIFAVADVFDALCSKRPYKNAMDFDDAIAIIEENAGRHFDPEVTGAFRVVAQEIFNRLAGCNEDDTRRLLKESIEQYFDLNPAFQDAANELPPLMDPIIKLKDFA